MTPWLVLSLSGSPNENFIKTLAKFFDIIVWILKENNAKASRETTKTTALDPNETIVSPDVKHFYTSVTLKEAIEIAYRSCTARSILVEFKKLLTKFFWIWWSAKYIPNVMIHAVFKMMASIGLFPHYKSQKWPKKECVCLKQEKPVGTVLQLKDDVNNFYRCTNCSCHPLDWWVSNARDAQADSILDVEE